MRSVVCLGFFLQPLPGNGPMPEEELDLVLPNTGVYQGGDL